MTDQTTPTVLAVETEVHNTGLLDDKGGAIFYETTIEALSDPGAPGFPRAWRVSGVPIRGGYMRRPNRRTSPVHVYSVQAARTMAKTMYLKYLRYVERTQAKSQLKAAAAEEDLAALARRL